MSRGYITLKDAELITVEHSTGKKIEIDSEKLQYSSGRIDELERFYDFAFRIGYEQAIKNYPNGG